MSSTDSNVPDRVSTEVDEVESPVPLVEATSEPKVGEYVGQCKWWSDKHGYGFVTVTSGEMKGKEVFLHYTGIRPLNSNYRTLRKGEYINFDIINGPKGMQGANVTGIGGGSLICDVNPYVKPVPRQSPAHTSHTFTSYNTPPQHTIASAAFITHGGGYRGHRDIQTTATPRVVRPYYRPRPPPPSQATTEDA